MSTPSSASRSAAPSSRLLWTTSTCSSHGTPAIFAGVRTRTLTRCPASSRRGTSLPPMYPVAPVTSTVFAFAALGVPFMGGSFSLRISAGGYKPFGAPARPDCTALDCMALTARPRMPGPAGVRAASLAPGAGPPPGRGRLGGPGILANFGYSCCLHSRITSGVPAMSLNGPSLTGLRRVLAEDKTFARVQAEASRPFTARSEDYQLSAPAGLRAALLAEMADGLAAVPSDGGASGGATPVVLAVPATGREAEDLAAALRAFLPADAVAEFPSWETLPHERLSPRSDTVGRR